MMPHSGLFGAQSKGFWGVLILVLLLSGAVGCARDEPLTIASHVWVGYEPMFLARSMGWLDEERVRLYETGAASDSMQALVDGRVDGAALTLDEVLQLREQGLDLVVILVFNISVGADKILARPPIASLADLAGKRVGFEQGAVGELMITEALRRAGLDRDEIEVVDLPAYRQLEAWRASAVDAVVTYEPRASRLEAEGAVNIFDSREIPEYIVDVLAVRRDRAGRGQSAALGHLVTEHLRALEYFHRNPEDAAFRMSTRLNLPADEVLQAYRGLLLPDLDNNRRLLGGSSPDLQETTRALVDFKVEQGLLQASDDLSDLFSGRYLPRPER